MLLTVLLLCIGTTAVHGAARIACPEGWFLFDNYCYYFDRGEVANGDASDDCIAIGAFFLYPYEEEEVNFLKSTLKGMDTTGAVGAWLNHEYDSEDGWDYSSDDYTDWADDPAPAVNGTCKFMSASKEWKWDAQDCNTEQDMISICSMRAIIKDCYESTCFLLSPDTPTNKCEEGEGYLAKIESKDENNFVKQFLREAKTEADKFPLNLFRFGGEVHIDGSDAGAEGTWVFADGEAMPFDDFDTDEPNNAGTDGEDCIVMASGRDFKWIDVTCDSLMNMYLCEEPMSGIVG